MRDLAHEFSDAFERYSDELFRHAYLRLSDRERALELTQETFLRAWDYCARGEEIRDYRPFLYRTLKHLIIDDYRKHKSVSLESLVSQEEGESVESLLPPEESNTLEQATLRFEGARAVACLQALPERYREALTLRYLSGLTPREIAEWLGESENVVSVRIHRGLQKLRALFELDGKPPVKNGSV